MEIATYYELRNVKQKRSPGRNPGERGSQHDFQMRQQWPISDFLQREDHNRLSFWLDFGRLKKWEIFVGL